MCTCWRPRAQRHRRSAWGPARTSYTPLLHNALFYFLAQRDGADVDPTVLEREPSHLNDAHAKVYETPEYLNGFLVHDLVPTGERVDTEGGWFDAGDYVKFAHTTAFVLAVMGEALRDHPELFTGDGPDFASEARFGLDWLLRQWDGIAQGPVLPGEHGEHGPRLPLRSRRVAPAPRWTTR